MEEFQLESSVTLVTSGKTPIARRVGGDPGVVDTVGQSNRVATFFT